MAAVLIGLDGTEFRVVTDATVRLVNLQSAGLDVVGRLAASDVAPVEADRRLRVISSSALGYQILSFNLARGEQAATPFGRDARVREAFEKAIDREALNQVVFEGRYLPSNQPEAPWSRYRSAAYPVPARDVAGGQSTAAGGGAEPGKAEPRCRLRRGECVAGPGYPGEGGGGRV